MNSQFTPGLPGLAAIRKHLGLKQSEVAQVTGTSTRWIGWVEACRRDCSQSLQRAIANALKCSITDLITEPDGERLDQIRAAYLQAQADAAKARLAGGAA